MVATLSVCAGLAAALMKMKRPMLSSFTGGKDDIDSYLEHFTELP